MMLVKVYNPKLAEPPKKASKHAASWTHEEDKILVKVYNPKLFWSDIAQAYNNARNAASHAPKSVRQITDRYTKLKRNHRVFKILCQLVQTGV
jgi:hypothetical protein